ncbi:lipopolysaccharide biosynthesis protein [Odoribacter sp. OttesenSCG-928-J03]|nr:lipopolysaccharide biosynthesis protein [Odoribacter sp. OttesenSCG-928-J03]
MGVVIRQSIKGTIINYIGAFIGFLTQMFIITKFLSPEDIGLTSVILEIAIMFGVLCQLGTSSSIMRYFPYFKNKENKNNGFFFYIVILPLIGSLIFIPIYLIFKTPIIAFLAKSSTLFTPYYYWIIPLIIFMAYWQVFEVYSTVNMRIVVPKFNREIGVRLMLVVVYLLYGFHVINRDGLVSGIMIVYGIILLITFIYVSRIAPISLAHDTSYVSKPLRKEFFKYTSYLIVGALGSTMLSRLDLFMVSSEMGYDYSGIFRIATYMAAVIDIPSRSISAISSPVAAEALKNGDFQASNKLYQKVSLHQLILGGFIFVLIWINVDNIFAIMPNGEIYAQGKWVVFFLGMAKLIEVTLNFGGILISFSKYYYWSLYFVFFIIIIGILTNYTLIPILGVSGAAIATTITAALSYSVQQWLVLKKVKGNPYTMGTLKTLSIFALLLGINILMPKVLNPWMDGLYRTALTVVAGLGLLYGLKVSDDVNRLLRTILRIKK